MKDSLREEKIRNEVMKGSQGLCQEQTNNALTIMTKLKSEWVHGKSMSSSINKQVSMEWVGDERWGQWMNEWKANTSVSQPRRSESAVMGRSVSPWTLEQIYEWMNKYTFVSNEGINEAVSQCLAPLMRKKVTVYLDEWMSEWMNDSLKNVCLSESIKGKTIIITV